MVLKTTPCRHASPIKKKKLQEKDLAKNYVSFLRPILILYVNFWGGSGKRDAATNLKIIKIKQQNIEDNENKIIFSPILMC